MSGISSKAIYNPENRYKYNGIELNSDFDLYSYEARYRNLDPQIGRFWQINPEVESSLAESPYVSMGNNPISHQDPLGNYFFGLFGSTREQRQAARAFAEELEGTEGYTGVQINNITKKSVNVQYTANYLEYGSELGQVTQTASLRTQHFRENGRPDLGSRLGNYWYDQEFDLERNTVLNNDGTRGPRPFPGTAEYVPVEAALVPIPPIAGALGRVIAAGKGANIGTKLEYVLGKATGSAHNIERSTGILRQLESVGIFDNAAGRSLLNSHLESAYNGSRVVLQSNGRYLRESLLMGPREGLKVESVWEGNKLITVKLIGGR